MYFIHASQSCTYNAAENKHVHSCHVCFIRFKHSKSLPGFDRMASRLIFQSLSSFPEVRRFDKKRALSHLFGRMCSMAWNEKKDAENESAKSSQNYFHNFRQVHRYYVLTWFFLIWFKLWTKKFTSTAVVSWVGKGVF
jgi:hypothetical protein